MSVETMVAVVSKDEDTILRYCDRTKFIISILVRVWFVLLVTIDKQLPPSNFNLVALIGFEMQEREEMRERNTI